MKQKLKIQYKHYKKRKLKTINYLFYKAGYLLSFPF